MNASTNELGAALLHRFLDGPEARANFILDRLVDQAAERLGALDRDRRRHARRFHPGVVILPDVRGLYRFYEELALRFAERGYAAVAFDFYGRTAGAEKRGEDFDYSQHREQTTPEGVQADVGACAAYLRPAYRCDLRSRRSPAVPPGSR